MQQAEPVDDRFLGDYLFSESPAQLVIVGDVSEELLRSPAAGIQVLQCNALDDAEAVAVAPAQLTQTIHRTLILQIKPDHHELELHLGRAIRAFPHRVLLHCHISSDKTPFTDNTFFAFGFKSLHVMQDEGMCEGHTRWYEYRLSDYKSAPDWLNARFWANPDRFDLAENPDEYCDEFDEEEE